MSTDRRFFITLSLLLLLSAIAGSISQLHLLTDPYAISGRWSGLSGLLSQSLLFLVPLLVYRHLPIARILSIGFLLFLLLFIHVHLSLLLTIGINLQSGVWYTSRYLYAGIFLWALTAYSWYHFCHKYLGGYRAIIIIPLFLLLASTYFFASSPLLPYVLPFGFGLTGWLGLSPVHTQPEPSRRADILDDM